MLWLAWIVLFVGLMITMFAGYSLKNDVDKREQKTFEVRCKEITVKIENRLAKHRQMLLSGVAMFEASENVTREEWRVYVKRLNLSRELDGVQGLGFSLWIQPEQLKNHEESIRKEGFPDYHVRPEGKREAYSSIIYLEPFQDRNLRAFSYDMYSEPVRRAAMNLAMETGRVTLSGKVTLLQESATDVQAGTLMYAPVYQKNKSVDSIKERKEAIFGWVYSPFRMTDLLHNIVLNVDDVNLTNLVLYVYDGSEMSDTKLLYQSSKNASNLEPLFSSQMQVYFLGTNWTLVFQEFVTPKDFFNYYVNVWITVFSGVSISFLLFFLIRSYFFMLKNASEIANKLIIDLRENEKKLALANADLLQFTTISAHHLQEPSRRLVSFVRRLHDALASYITLDQNVTMILHFIEQSAIRQRALVRDVQIYLSAPQPRAVVEAVPVVEIIEKVIENNTLLIKKCNASIQFSNLPDVVLDRPRLFDIFNALIKNSLQYRRESHLLEIHIYGEHKKNFVRYSIEDNGIGIPEEYRERVFGVFERLQVSADQESTGIGLAIVRSIVQSVNGSIRILDTVGGGTTIVFELPAALIR